MNKIEIYIQKYYLVLLDQYDEIYLVHTNDSKALDLSISYTYIPKHIRTHYSIPTLLT